MRNSLEYRIKETLLNTGNQGHQLAQQRAWFYSFYHKGYRSGLKDGITMAMALSHPVKAHHHGIANPEGGLTSRPGQPRQARVLPSLG
jgi:hypothetical protein